MVIIHKEKYISEKNSVSFASQNYSFSLKKSLSISPIPSWISKKHLLSSLTKIF